ncbi:holin-like protein [Gallaecimonas pentaromativorans]|uniref:Holin-like protein n=2 Tax=Gallaecimonas pentaromativorans TaxID=584787 RepID=A0A3N1PB38_9GAMM|nr:holin-like protein [Gallaecimonas pentaromativorans]
MKMLRAVFIIVACLWAGKGLVALLPVPIPGSIIGMLLLFLLLSSKLVKADWVMPFSAPLIRHMTLLFIPAGVGLMNYLDVIKAHGLVLVGACFFSTLLVLITIGRWHDRQGGRRGD